jgi:hypothetical protein
VEEEEGREEEEEEGGSSMSPRTTCTLGARDLSSSSCSRETRLPGGEEKGRKRREMRAIYIYSRSNDKYYLI